jgi:acyl carrier protein
MNRNDVFERISKIIVEQLEVEAAEVTESANFIEDLNADSLDLVELIMEVEEEFEATIPDTEVEKLRTVGDAVSFILSNS